MTPRRRRELSVCSPAHHRADPHPTINVGYTYAQLRAGTRPTPGRTAPNTPRGAAARSRSYAAARLPARASAHEPEWHRSRPRPVQPMSVVMVPVAISSVAGCRPQVTGSVAAWVLKLSLVGHANCRSIVDVCGSRETGRSRYKPSERVGVSPRNHSNRSSRSSRPATQSERTYR
jgi:hypothetical protein